MVCTIKFLIRLCALNELTFLTKHKAAAVKVFDIAGERVNDQEKMLGADYFIWFFPKRERDCLQMRVPDPASEIALWHRTKSSTFFLPIEYRSEG